MLRFSLRDAGFEITEAATGGEALTILQELAPEAVILDLDLPDGLGGAVLEWLHRSNGATAGGPAWVVVSAQDQSDVVRRYGPLGKRFLAKPFDPWELVTRLQDLLVVDGNPQVTEEE